MEVWRSIIIFFIVNRPADVIALDSAIAIRIPVDKTSQLIQVSFKLS
jgi:hypothetical protein